MDRRRFVTATRPGAGMPPVRPEVARDDGTVVVRPGSGAGVSPAGQRLEIVLDT